MTARRYTAQSAIAPCPAWLPGMPALAGLPMLAARMLLALVFACAPARARDTGTDPALVIDRFIQHYERTSRHLLATLPGMADRTIPLDEARQPLRSL